MFLKIWSVRCFKIVETNISFKKFQSESKNLINIHILCTFETQHFFFQENSEKFLKNRFAIQNSTYNLAILTFLKQMVFIDWLFQNRKLFDIFCHPLFKYGSAIQIAVFSILIVLTFLLFFSCYLNPYKKVSKNGGFCSISRMQVDYRRNKWK